MDSDARLSKLFKKGGVTFSIETLESAHVLITITKMNGTTTDTVGGTYDSVDEGINDCIDKLDIITKKRQSKLKVVK